MSAQLQTTRLEFCCPKCDGSYFGSSGSGDNYKGHCSGNGGRDYWDSCSFTWDRKDDWKYFIIAEYYSFPSEADYLEAQARL